MRDEQIKVILDGLALLEVKIKNCSVARLTDLNQVSEDFFSEFLNELRGLRLENLNKKKPNHPAIDLGDTENRIAFQITSTKTASKIQDTINKFVEHNLQTTYDDLYILILGKKQRQYTTITNKGINFDADKHVIDIHSLIREISCGLQVNQLKNLERLLRNENLVIQSSHNTTKHGDEDRAIATATRKWAQDSRSSSLAVACIIGEWRKDFEGDRVTIESFLSDGYTAWLRDMQSILEEVEAPIRLKNGHWSVVDRKALWAELAGCIFDEDLDHLKDAAAKVLTEVDPKFEIPVENRLFSFDGQEKKHFSDSIRKGIAGGSCLPWAQRR